VRLVTVNSGNVKLIRTSVCVLIVTTTGAVTEKNVPLTIAIGSKLTICGSLEQSFAIAERVRV
jgi:hypothetical protein